MRLGILGPLLVIGGDGQEIVMSAPLQRVLLAVLVVRANRIVAADELAELVWDGAPPAGAARTLRSYMGRLRQWVGPVVAARILTRDPGYMCQLAEDESDALRFAALCRQAAQARRDGAWSDLLELATRALSEWRDTPLQDVPSELLRDELTAPMEQLRIQVLEDCIEAYLQLGQYDTAVPQLRELITANPLRERFHAQSMRALAGLGRRAEALEAYRDARKVLIEQLGIEPGPELQRLHEQVLGGDTAESTSPEADRATPSARTDVPVPRQLPAAVRHFTGRQAELEALFGALKEVGRTRAAGGTVVISAIDGMAGIGKTALAVYVAHHLAEEFPGGQLFLDLHGYTQGHPPRTAADALNWLLQALGVPPQRIPADVEQAATLYRQRLADTKTLIVLDNAVTEAQVRPLLPGTSACLVLVTSRRRLKGLDDAHLVSLDLLAPEDAVALLCAVAGPGRIPADDPLVGEVAELCGHLPLALRIAASLLRHRPAWSLEHLAGQLRDQHHRVTALSDGERDLAGVFDLSYAGLDEQHQRLWRRLGLTPGPDLDAYAAAALLEVDPASATGLLEDLVDHNLLSAYVPDRYRLHDLLRAYARTLAASDPESDREAALSRLLHYYAHTAQSASVPIALYPRSAPTGLAPAYTPALAEPDAARSWLCTEHANLDAAFTHAHADGLDGHAIALAAGLAEILRTDGPWTRALAVHQIAAETAEHRDDHAAHATALTDLGRVRSMTGDVPGAGDAHSRALEISRTLGDRNGEAGALTGLARVRAMSGDFPGAVAAASQALEIYRTLGNPGGEITALIELGRMQYQTGDYPGADESLTRALGIAHAHGRRLSEANALNDLGRVQFLIGNFPGAADAATRALDIYRTLGNKNGEAGSLVELGRVRSRTGDLPGAGDAHTRALEIFRALGNRDGEAHVLIELGRVQTLTGDLAGAADTLVRALELYRALGARGNEAVALNYYAAALAAAGERTRALELYQQALAMNRELNKPDDEATSLEGIAEHHLAADEPARGAEHLQQALEIYQRLGMAPDERRVQERLSSLAKR